jgi:mono/diheme cytochrome c family protein
LTVALIVITGILRSIAHVDGPRNLTGADYGIVLIAKHLLFLPILVAAGINLLVIVPRLRAASARGETEYRAAMTRSASHFVAAELVFAVATLLAAAALTEIVPAEGPLPVDVAAKTVTIDQRSATGDLDVWLLAMLQGEDSDRYSLTITTADGAVPGELQRVIVVSSTTLGESTLGDRFDATELSGSPGTFTFPAVRLGLRGLWDLEVIVRRAGVEDASTSFSVDTSQAGQPAPRLVDDGWSMPRLTIPAWSMGFFALFVLVGGLVALMKLRELQPFAAAILLTMTLLIAAGFAVQSYRLTIPVTAATNLANPIPADDASIARGENTYTRQCLICHGPLGAGLETEEDPSHLHGDSADLTDPRSADQRDGDLFHAISNGVADTDMPAFDQALTEAERWDVVNYLRTLQGR